MKFSMNRWYMLVPTGALAVVLLAACGGTSVEGDVTRVSDVANAPEAVKLATEVANMPPEASPVPEGGDAAAETPATGGEVASADAVTVTSHDIYFEPAEVSIPADTDVTFTLPNAGAAPHNFSIDALNISVDEQPGETKTQVINAPAGEYEYYCNVPGHKEAGMVGKLTAGGAAAPAADAAAPAADAAAPAAAANAATVTSHDIYFEPTELTIPADTDVTFTLTNAGAAPHNFSIDALKISVDEQPGETKEQVINAPAGEYEYYCNVPGHKEAGMVGKLTVGGAAPAADAAPPAAETPADAAAPAEGSPAADAAAPAAAAAEVTVTSMDIYFDPKEVSIPAATDVKFILPNKGAAPHNFSIDALKISVDQNPGETKEQVINAPAGEYEYYCNIPGHKEAGMVGKLTAK